MRSRAEHAVRVLTAVLLLAAGSHVVLRAGQPRAIDDAEIARAMEVVATDPQIAPERTFKSLKWRGSPQSGRSTMPAWMLWIAGLFDWVGQSTRYLVWAAAGILAVLLVRYVAGIAGRHISSSAADEPIVAPTHVRDLDIRPESLPADIGQAARLLWDDGQHRAALALLYRGLLSRLAHVHGIPIRDSTTEGDCLRLGDTHLGGDRRDYAARLIRIWQRAVYGREAIGTAVVYELCDRFAAALNGESRDAARAEGRS